jgi:hypothetical protein
LRDRGCHPFECYPRRGNGAVQVGGEADVNACTAPTGTKLGRELATLLGELAWQPAGGITAFVVRRQRMRFKDNLDSRTQVLLR